jgi:hypothetical protein
MKRSWRNVPFTVADEVEIVLHCTSTGYYDSGVHTFSNGDPGYPPEGEDERQVVGVYLMDGNGNERLAPPAVLEWLREIYAEKIDDAEVPCVD